MFRGKIVSDVVYVNSQTFFQRRFVQVIKEKKKYHTSLNFIIYVILSPHTYGRHVFPVFKQMEVTNIHSQPHSYPRFHSYMTFEQRTCK